MLVTFDPTRRTLLRLAAGVALALPLAACGKRGALERPPTEEEARADQQAAQSGQARPKRRRDITIKPPRKDTPFDILL